MQITKSCFLLLSPMTGTQLAMQGGAVKKCVTERVLLPNLKPKDVVNISNLKQHQVSIVNTAPHPSLMDYGLFLT